MVFGSVSRSFFAFRGGRVHERPAFAPHFCEACAKGDVERDQGLAPAPAGAAADPAGCFLPLNRFLTVPA